MEKDEETSMNSTANQVKRRVAAVDIGSNTVHLVIVDSNGVSDLTVVGRQVDLARLGADVAATGEIGEQRAARVEATLRAMAERAAQLGAEARLGLATEGVRAARNAQAMLARFSAAWGGEIALITGLEEAVLTFWGATASFSGGPPGAETPQLENANPSGLPGGKIAGRTSGGGQDTASSDGRAGEKSLPRLGVGDLGGGSCEFVVGTTQKIAYATSLPLGSGRLVDLVQPADPPTAEQFAAMLAAAGERVQALTPPDPPLDALIAVGGTATSLARFLGAGDILATADLDRARDILLSAPASVLAAQSGVDAERVRIIAGGVAAWQAIMQRVGATELRVSANGVREGAIIAWLRAPDGDWRAVARAALPNDIPSDLTE